MRKINIISALIFLLFEIGCTSNNRNEKKYENDSVNNLKLLVQNKIDTPDSKTPPITTINVFDTTLYLFSNKSKCIEFEVFNTKELNEYKKNSVVRILSKNSVANDTLIIDSLYCLYPDVMMKDFNGDKALDLLLFYNTGGRANPTYHLYIINKDTLCHINGFENLPSPDYDSVNNVISSTGLGGPDVYFKFYRINKKNKLVNLGFDYLSGPDDSIKYAAMVNSLKKGIIQPKINFNKADNKQ